MKEPTTDIAYALSPKDVTALARAIINHADSSSAGRVTYLKSLLAGVQVELLGKPVLRVLRATHKPPTIEAALAALEKVNATYYEAVLAAVPDGLDALERNAKTAFARSAASTLRRAIATGWSVYTPLNDAAKVTLSRWVKDHSTPRPITPQRAQTKVAGLVERIAVVLKALTPEEARALAKAALADLAEFSGEQILRPVSLRRHSEARAAH